MAGVTEEGCIVYFFVMGLYSKWVRYKDVLTATEWLKKIILSRTQSQGRIKMAGQVKSRDGFRPYKVCGP